jgi:nucleoside-diphosphate-sugar epimerase
MIGGSAPVTLALHFGYVDVRDVVEAHIQAMKNEISDGKRIIVSEREIWL